MSELGIRIQPTEPVRCVFSLAEAAAGISIGYEVVIDADVPDVVAQAQTTCTGPGPSGLAVFEQISGNGQSYCICDSGLCPPPPDTPKTLKAGTYPGSFEWDGKNWSGPSDTGNPKGPPFPAGSYELLLSAKGTQGTTPFDVQSTLVVTLVP